MTQQTPTRRVILAKTVARRWLLSRAKPEYRLTIYQGGRDIRALPAVFRMFRDGRTRIGSVDPDPTLGIREGFDSITIWSRNKKAVLGIKEWFESKGFETTGVW